MLLAVCQEFELEPGNPASPAIASGFAGGIGNAGAVCGAMVGGIMALGLKLGRAESMEDKPRSLAVTRDFRRRFETEMGEIGCRELTGLDLSQDDQIAQLMNSDVPRKVCFPAVSVAYRLAVELLREAGK